MSEKERTRAEYQESLQKKNESTNDERDSFEKEEISRVTRLHEEKRSQRFSPDEKAEERSWALAKKLNIAIALLAIGIILVFLILFFVG